MRPPPRPTKDDLANARDKTVPDIIAPGLKVLFCGINPGLYSGATGCHFARPGNRFWPALHLGGFTPRQLAPYERKELLSCGLGITNVVMRTTAAAAELSNEELKEGVAALRRKVLRYRPRYLAVLGLHAYRIGFRAKAAAVGEQPEHIGDTKVWLLPNPSGLNAHYQLPTLSAAFADLHKAADARSARRDSAGPR
ncbi:MAG: G/U mismatch-specific DNA glycosylase [Actinomycetota bacterium]